jgi:putative DNA primase/helicase
LWWSFNHAPQVSDQTFSIWRRIKIIPFTEVIPSTEMDKNLATKLVAELPGIFNWAVEGLKEYYKNGLQEPTDVTAAVTSYKNDQDILKDFFDENFEDTESDLDRVKASELYNGYKTWWFNIETTKPLTSTMFGRLCRDRGLHKMEDRAGKWYTHLRFTKVKFGEKK